MGRFQRRLLLVGAAAFLLLGGTPGEYLPRLKPLVLPPPLLLPPSPPPPPLLPLLPLLPPPPPPQLAGQGISGALYGSSHTLKYFYSGVSQPNQSLPQFFMAGYLDDELFLQHDGSAGKQYMVPWLAERKNFYPWMSSLYAFPMKKYFRDFLKQMRNPKIPNKGLLTWQWMYTCELKEDEQFWQSGIGYNGSSFFSFSMDNFTWLVTDIQAERRQKVDHEQSYFMKNKCIGLLRSYLRYNNIFHFEPRVKKPPVVTMTSKMEADGMETLTCQMNDFYPQKIRAAWIKYGEPQGKYSGYITQNSDETFSQWMSIKINPKDRHRYQCDVRHDGLKEPLNVILNRPPVVTVSGEIEPNGMEILMCHLEGFYPKEINASWKKNGKFCHQQTVNGTVTPSLYGTYRQWLSIRISPLERDLYQCHVEHEALQEPLDVAVNESSLMLILGCVFIVLVLVVAISGLSLYVTSDGGRKSLDEEQSVHLTVPLKVSEDQLEDEHGFRMESPNAGECI